MAENNPNDQAAGQTPAPKGDLPQIESPSISPGEDKPAETEKAAAVNLPIIAPAPAKANFKLRPRHKRAALLAATITLAAAFGSLIGAVTTERLAAANKPAVDTAALEQRKAVEKTIAHLSQQVATLKTNLDTATRTAHRDMENAHGEMAKLAQRLAAAAADVTGSITPPQTAPPAQSPQPQHLATPLPPPRPPLEQLASAVPPPARPAVVPDWTLRAAHDGMALVEGRGELYQAVLGAPLPGLGPVQTIKREDGRWIVVTPRGIIVSARDRHYFE